MNDDVFVHEGATDLKNNVFRTIVNSAQAKHRDITSQIAHDNFDYYDGFSEE
jgi:hypothetical protein